MSGALSVKEKKHAKDFFELSFQLSLENDIQRIIEQASEDFQDAYYTRNNALKERKYYSSIPVPNASISRNSQLLDSEDVLEKGYLELVKGTSELKEIRQTLASVLADIKTEPLLSAFNVNESNWRLSRKSHYCCCQRILDHSPMNASGGEEPHALEITNKRASNNYIHTEDVLQTPEKALQRTESVKTKKANVFADYSTPSNENETPAPKIVLESVATLPMVDRARENSNSISISNPSVERLAEVDASKRKNSMNKLSHKRIAVGSRHSSITSQAPPVVEAIDDKPAIPYGTVLDSATLDQKSVQKNEAMVPSVDSSSKHRRNSSIKINKETPPTTLDPVTSAVSATRNLSPKSINELSGGVLLTERIGPKSLPTISSTSQQSPINSSTGRKEGKARKLSNAANSAVGLKSQEKFSWGNDQALQAILPAPSPHTPTQSPGTSILKKQELPKTGAQKEREGLPREDTEATPDASSHSVSLSNSPVQLSQEKINAFMIDKNQKNNSAKKSNSRRTSEQIVEEEGGPVKQRYRTNSVAHPLLEKKGRGDTNDSVFSSNMLPSHKDSSTKRELEEGSQGLPTGANGLMESPFTTTDALQSPLSPFPYSVQASTYEQPTIRAEKSKSKVVHEEDSVSESSIVLDINIGKETSSPPLPLHNSSRSKNNLHSSFNVDEISNDSPKESLFFEDVQAPVADNEKVLVFSQRSSAANTHSSHIDGDAAGNKSKANTSRKNDSATKNPLRSSPLVAIKNFFASKRSNSSSESSSSAHTPPEAVPIKARVSSSSSSSESIPPVPLPPSLSEDEDEQIGQVKELPKNTTPLVSLITSLEPVEISRRSNKNIEKEATALPNPKLESASPINGTKPSSLIGFLFSNSSDSSSSESNAEEEVNIKGVISKGDENVAGVVHDGPIKEPAPEMSQTEKPKSITKKKRGFIANILDTLNSSSSDQDTKLSFLSQSDIIAPPSKEDSSQEEREVKKNTISEEKGRNGSLDNPPPPVTLEMPPPPVLSSDNDSGSDSSSNEGTGSASWWKW